MDFVRLWNWMIPLLVLATLLGNLPFLPNIVSVITNIGIGLVSLVSQVFIYKYYGSLPAPMTTVLTQLMQLSMLSCGLTTTVQLIIRPCIVTFASSLLQSSVNQAPNATCSLFLVPEIYFRIGCYFFFAISFYKAMAKLAPNMYLNMNHEKVKWITMAIIMITCIAENSFLAFYYKTLCTKLTLHKYENIFSKTTHKIYTKPQLLIFHFAFLWIPQLVLWIVKAVQKRSTNQKERSYLEPRNELLAKEISSGSINSTQGAMVDRKKDTEPTTEKTCIEIAASKTKMMQDSFPQIRQIQVVPYIGQHCNPSTSCQISSEAVIIDIGKAIELAEFIKKIKNLEDTSTTRKSNIQEDEPTVDDVRANIHDVKPPMLKMDMFFYLGVLASLLIIVSIVSIGQNSGLHHIAFWFMEVSSILILVVVPVYWIKRSDEIAQFALRRIARVLNPDYKYLII